MNHDLAPIPAFAEPTPPHDSDLAAILARAERVGIAPERVLLALGYPRTATAPAGPLAQQVNGTQSTAS